MISHTYKQQLLGLRDTRPNWGNSAYRYGELVKDFAKELGAESVFDFGCGTGSLKDAIKPLDWEGYDPAVKFREELPDAPQDLAVAIDVFEHVERGYVEEAIETLYKYANLGVFLHISLVPARHSLPDGRNAHITLLPAQKWVDLLLREDLRHWEARQTEKWLRFYGRKRVTDEVE